MAKDKQTQVWLGFFAGALFALAGILRLVGVERKGHGTTDMFGGFLLIAVGLFWAVLAAGWKRKSDQ